MDNVDRSFRQDDAIDFGVLVDLFERYLTLCGLRRGERLALLREEGKFETRARAFAEAGRRLGVEADHVVHHAPGTPTGPEAQFANLGRSGLIENKTAMALLTRADIVVDMMLLLFSREQIVIQQSGTRIVLVVEPIDILIRLFPTPDLRKRVEAAELRLLGARELRFVNQVGTDIQYDVEGQPVLTEYGYSDEPGRWDHWPGGFLATIPRAGSAKGVVVLAPGDFIYPLKRMVERPVRLAVANGIIVDIAGDADAKALSDYMAAYHDPRAFAISHIGWGLNAACQWDASLPGIGMDGRAFYGNVLFSTGPDTEFGGVNDTPCHLDIPMRNCSLYLDDVQILDRGRILPPEMRTQMSENPPILGSA